MLPACRLVALEEQLLAGSNFRSVLRSYGVLSFAPSSSAEFPAINALGLAVDRITPRQSGDGFNALALWSRSCCILSS